MIAVFFPRQTDRPMCGCACVQRFTIVIGFAFYYCIGFCVDEDTKKKMKRGQKLPQCFEHCTFFFFGRTFFEDLHLLRLTMTSIYICLVTCILPLFNCPVNHLVTVNIIHISFNSISYFTERNYEAR